jgi:cell wall-associated NlpC family hydrolase
MSSVRLLSPALYRVIPLLALAACATSPDERRADRPASVAEAEADEAGNEIAFGVIKSEKREPDPPDRRYEPRPDLDRRARSGWAPPEDRTVVATLASAEEYLGTPYVWGGASPEPGFDCSGFIQYVYDEIGIPLPRPSRRMALAGVELPPVVDSLRAGDLMFFSEDGDRITHVAIYAGNNEILHASGSGSGVGYDPLGTYRGSWYLQNFVAAARVVGVPIRAMRARPIPITPATWDPVSDGAPPPGTGPGGG